VAHAPCADRTGNAASKLLSVLTASARADLDDAHASKGISSNKVSVDAELRRRPLAQVVFRDHWDEPAGRLTGAAP
jgi:hypothetical protein